MAKIVVADDDESYSLVLKEALEAAGHKVFRVFDSAELAFWLEKEVPDLIMLDMQMPGGGGPGSMKLIKDKPALADVPVIIVSNMPVAQQRQWFEQIKKIRFFNKSSEIKDIVKSAGDLLSQELK